MGASTDFVPTKEKIELGYQIKEQIDRALELCDTDAALHFMKGRWCWGECAAPLACLRLKNNNVQPLVIICFPEQVQVRKWSTCSNVRLNQRAPKIFLPLATHKLLHNNSMAGHLTQCDCVVTCCIQTNQCIRRKYIIFPLLIKCLCRRVKWLRGENDLLRRYRLNVSRSIAELSLALSAAMYSAAICLTFHKISCPDACRLLLIYVVYKTFGGSAGQRISRCEACILLQVHKTNRNRCNSNLLNLEFAALSFAGVATQRIWNKHGIQTNPRAASARFSACCLTSTLFVRQGCTCCRG